MTTHTWASGSSGYIYDASHYADGTPFAPGDTLVVSSGTPNAVSKQAGSLASLYPGSYQFNATGATEGLQFGNIAFEPNTTLSVVGPQKLFWTGTGQFANNGLIQVGSPKASGSVDYSVLDESTPDGSFTNNGVITLQNGSLLQFEPLSSGNGTFLNAAGAVLRIGAGSAFQDFGPTDVGKSTVFQNNGLVELDGAAGRQTTFDAPAPLSSTGGVSYQGAGVLTVQGAAGDAPSDTVAIIHGGGGQFNVSSGQVQFDSSASPPPSRAINFLDNNGQIVDNVLDTSISISAPLSSVKPMNATISGFVAGDAITYQMYYPFNGTRSNPTFSYNPATHQLMVTIEPGQVSTLTLNGNYTQADFKLTPLSSSNTTTFTTTSTANAVTAALTPAPPPTPTSTPVPTPTPVPPPVSMPTPSANPTVAAFVSATLPAASYNAAGFALASAGLGAAAGAGGTVAAVTSAAGTFGAAQPGSASVGVATTPAAGSTLTLPAGYAGLVAGGSGAVTLSDRGAAGAVLVGNGAGDTFISSGQNVSLVGGGGPNTFNVSGTGTVSTGDGASTVRLSGQAAAATVFTGAGGSTVMLAGGSSTVQGNGQDTVFGGTGASKVTAAKGLVAVGSDGRMTFIGGSATSLVFGAKGGVDYTAGSAYDIAVGGSGTLVAQGGAAGGQFWGNSGSDVLRAGGSTASVLVANNGGRLYSEGAAGNFLIAGAGTAVLDGSKASGSDVFFGGTGNDTITAGSGNDLIGTGTGASTVQLGSGQDTVFAFGTSTVTAGSGNANMVMGGTVTLDIASGAARSFALFNFVPGTDKISLSGYGSAAVANALATQVSGSGQTVLTLGDQTRIQLIGVTRADASFFA